MWSRINAQLKDEHHASEWRNFYKCGWKQNSKETTDRNVHPIVKDKDGLGSAMIGTHEFIKKKVDVGTEYKKWTSEWNMKNRIVKSTINYYMGTCYNGQGAFKSNAIIMHGSLFLVEIK